MENSITNNNHSPLSLKSPPILIITDKVIEEIFETISSFDYLDERDKKSLTKYIEEVYYAADRPERFLLTL